MEKKVTVCLITYNQESYIADAIEGVLMQKGIDFNLVIYNDCSTDGTAKICESYRKRNPELITLVNQSVNKGIIMNTKECMLAATGNYIAFCEGDDYWVDEYKLRDQIKILEQHPEIVLTCTNWINCYPLKKPMELIPNAEFIYDGINLKGEKLINSLIIEKCQSIRFSSVCFRTKDLYKAIKENNPFKSTYSTVDISFFLAFAQLGNFYWMSRYTTIYRIFPGTVSNAISDKKRLDFNKGLINIYSDYFENNYINEKIIKLRFDTLLPQAFEYSLLNKNKEIMYFLLDITKKHNYKLSIGKKICKFGIFFPILWIPSYILVKFSLWLHRKI